MPTPQNQAPAGVTFDAQPLPQSTTTNVPAGITFDDAPLQTATAVSVSGTQPNAASSTSASTSAVPDALHIGSDDNVALKLAKGVNAFGAGAGEGVLSTLNGAADMLHLPHDTLKARQGELELQNRENPTLNAAGKGTETLLELISGDEALKGLSLSKRLLASSKIAEALENSPRLMEVLHGALRAGVTGGAQGTIRSGGDLKTGAEEGAGAAAFAGALGSVPAAVKAIRSALNPESIQAPLQTAIRDVMKGVADHHGLSAPSSASIRDVADDIAKQVKAKASSLYQQMDQISGGQAQRFRDAAENVAQKLRETTGLDDEAEAKLLAQQQKITEAHKAMLDKLEAAGHPRDLLEKADQLWTKQGALNDVTNAIRQSVTGMRPELGGPNASAESVAVKPLFAKLNRLHNSGRLTQAVGPGNAEAILQAVDQAYVRAKAIQSNSRMAGLVAKAAATAGLGGLGYEGVKFAHGLLGGN